MKKFLNKEICKKICILTILLFLYVGISAISYAKSTSSEISNSVFRLHVLANSDSSEDQNLKYKVRDKLISYMNTICSATTSKKEAIYIAQNHLNDFQKIAEQTISENGYTYPIKVEIGNFDFPTKTYGDISLPVGSYDALRVEIGKAQGQNWWCVMFPPLCFIDVSSGIVPDESKELLKENMNEEDFALISDNNSHSDISFKFKILEFFGSKKFTTAKN